MKNKHLVLLFLLTLVVGLAVRRAPWRNSTYFQTNLLRVDTLAVEQIQIMLTGQTPLFLVRNDAGWTAEQNDRNATVPPEVVQKMLIALADLRSIQIVKTDRPDTLGFNPGSLIQLSLTHDKDQIETLALGNEIVENNQAATYVQLPRHEGIYLVNNHLRAIFTKKLADFRNTAIAQFSPSSVQGFAVFGRRLDSLAFQKNGVTGSWVDPVSGKSCPNDSVQIWLTKLAQLRGLSFSNLFDESHASETFYAQINLELVGQAEPLVLQIFDLNLHNLPEDLPAQKLDQRQLAPFVLHSSQNRANYFTLSDTVLLRQICRPF